MTTWGREIYDAVASISPLELDLGRVPGAVSVYRVGRNSQISRATDPEDVTELGGLYTGQPDSGVAETLTIVSDDANDTLLGTGMRTGKVVGLDENWQDVEFDFNMNGTTDVETTGQQFHRVFEVYGTSFGSGGENAGIITGHHTTTTGNIFFGIPVGRSNSALCVGTIPAGKTGLILDWRITSSRGSGSGYAGCQFLTREQGSGYRVRDYEDAGLNAAAITSFLNIMIPEKTDWLVRVREVSDDNTVVTANVHYLLLDNAHFGL